MPNFTKQAIKDSFLKLLNQQPLSKISVRSIVEDCGINRNSFYYHYQDIPTLLGEIIKDEVDMLIEQYPTISSLDECVQVAFRFARENRKAVQHIYSSANRDIYESYYMKLCEYIVRTYLDTAFGKNVVSEADRAIAIRFIKCELFGLSLDWVAAGMPEDALDSIRRVLELCRGMPDQIISRSRQEAPPGAAPQGKKLLP